VTQEAGLSHGVVNFHFDSKEALFVETLGHLAREHYAQWSGAVAKAGECPAAKLEALVRADFDPSVCSRKKLSVWFAFWGQAKHRPIYLETHDEHDRERGALIGELCATIIADGDYPQDDAATVGRNIEAVIDGLWLQMLLYPKLLSRPTALASALAFLATLFPKHFPRPSEPA
jgi:TetR/AcrR family transcriptional repressor of bet genes